MASEHEQSNLLAHRALIAAQSPHAKGSEQRLVKAILSVSFRLEAIYLLLKRNPDNGSLR